MASDRLLLIRAEIKRMQRNLRMLNQLVAKEIESTATDSPQSEEDTDNGSTEGEEGS